MKTITLAVVTGVMIIGIGCTKDTFDSTADFDAVITVESPDYDYTQNRTYAVVEEVADLSTLITDAIHIENKERWEEVILKAIHRNMKAAGYTETTGDIQEADIVVGAGIVAQERWQFYTYYPWWGWGGWWYYYYPGFSYATDFSSGSVILVMIDPDQMDDDTDADAGAEDDAGVPTDAYQAVWLAGIQSLLDSVTERKVNDSIDQAFEQSPYLKQKGGAR
jgi:hypothetical protein